MLLSNTITPLAFMISLPLCFQRITGSTLGHDLRMFGQSLSSGIDIDDNGYKGKQFCATTSAIFVSLDNFKHAEPSLSLQMWQLVRSFLTQLWFSGKSSLKLPVETLPKKTPSVVTLFS